MLGFNLAATPLFDLIGPTPTEFLLGLLLLGLGVGGYFYFRRGEGGFRQHLAAQPQRASDLSSRP
jgi:hypothetical protein